MVFFISINPPVVKGNTYGMNDNATMSQHGMEIQMPHRAYKKRPEMFDVQATLEPTNYNVNHGQEVVGGNTVPETLVDDQ